MDIKTKYNIGDSVFFMNDNRVWQGEIESFDIGFSQRSSGEKYITISYCVKTMFFTDFSVAENKLFTTKEDLLKSL